MFKLYGNNKVLDTFNTKKECKIARKDYTEIAKAIYGKCNIKFKIVEEV